MFIISDHNVVCIRVLFVICFLGIVLTMSLYLLTCENRGPCGFIYALLVVAIHVRGSCQ